ncbi:MAG TPA: folylpolyglutamate synthase/dihydrofolate synthase family protein [Dehalococcoidia bacterium]
MTYREALDLLQRVAALDYERAGVATFATTDPQLTRMRALLAHLGDPQQGRRTVHVAGSKGKGSTAAMVAAVLRAAGARTGLYTSPHLHDFRERIVVDGAPIPEEAFAALAGEVAAAGEAVLAAGHGRPTLFELLTALAFLHFRAAEVRWQVVEVGLGGRLDPTNVLDQKEVCVITPLSLEHTAVLGSTLPEIAAEKAAIIRPGNQVVMALQREPAADVVRARCAEVGAALHEVAAECAVRRDRADADGQEFRLRTPAGLYALRLPLLGRHQVENAAAAVRAAELAGAFGPEVRPEHVREGLAEVRWPGRLEVLKRRPLLVVDGAHNVDSARRLRDALHDHFGGRRVILVVGVLRDKDMEGMARELAPAAETVIAVGLRHPRSAAAADVAAAFARAGAVPLTAPDVGAAVDQAWSLAGPEDLICVCGSLAAAAEAREHVLGIVPGALRP